MWSEAFNSSDARQTRQVGGVLVPVLVPVPVTTASGWVSIDIARLLDCMGNWWASRFD